MAKPIPDPETENQETERPSWLPENFNSPEDLARSYTEAQRKITEQGQQLSAQEASLSELAAQFEEFEQNAPRQPAYDPSADPFIAGYEQALELGDARSMLAYQAQMTAAAVQQGIAEFARNQQQQSGPQIEAQYATIAYSADQMLGQKYPDWGDYKERIAETIQKAPYLVPEEALSSPLATAEALDRVYRQVKFDDLTSGTAQQEQQTRASEEARRLADLAPQTAGRILVGGDAAKEEWERVKAAGSGLDAFLSRG